MLFRSGALLESLALLMAASVVHLAVPEALATQARPSAMAFNAAISRLNLAGGDLGVLVSPEIGSALGATLLETFVRNELATPDGADEATLMRQMAAGLRASDRRLLNDGQIVTDAAEEETMLRETAKNLTGEQWTTRRALSIYD